MSFGVESRMGLVKKIVVLFACSAQPLERPIGLRGQSFYQTNHELQCKFKVQSSLSMEGSTKQPSERMKGSCSVQCHGKRVDSVGLCRIRGRENI